MSDSFYVLGGTQKTLSLNDEEWWREWIRYKHALILRVYPEKRFAETVVQYESPPDAYAASERGSILFKAGTRVGDTLYACTSTEVLIYSLPSFKCVGYISHPYFNDLHHVRPTPDGNLAVVSTGLDLVLVVSRDGQLVAEYPVLDQDPWERFSRSIDYRKVATTKPHASHPNYCFYLGNELWATRLEQKDAVCLPRRDKRFEIGLNYVHDGVLHGSRIYFTTVDGRIVVFDAETRSHVRTLDLNRLSDGQAPLGWCRGIHILDEDTVLVGFTRLKRTKWREKVAWVKTMFGGQGFEAPTRIGAVDLRNERLLWEFDLEPYKMHTLFSIHEA